MKDVACIGCSPCIKAKPNCQQRATIVAPKGSLTEYNMKKIKTNEGKWHTMVCYARPAKVCICFKRVAVNLLIMEIKVGDRFKAYNPEKEIIYIITDVFESKYGKRVRWDCIGKIAWMKVVTINNIIEWIEAGRLTKIN